MRQRGFLELIKSHRRCSAEFVALFATMRSHLRCCSKVLWWKASERRFWLKKV